MAMTPEEHAAKVITNMPGVGNANRRTITAAIVAALIEHGNDRYNEGFSAGVYEANQAADMSRD